MGQLATPGDDASIRTARMLLVGDKVRFREGRSSWTVRARDHRYIICTQPFNLRHTVLYTVIDLELGIRGTDDFGGLGYETEEQITEAMSKFSTPHFGAEISRRNNVSLAITRVGPGGGDVFLVRGRPPSDVIHTSACRHAAPDMRWVWADRNPGTDWAKSCPWLAPCRHCNPPSPLRPKRFGK
jgi:hypothetical protein